jgi:hypothetical protein
MVRISSHRAPAARGILKYAIVLSTFCFIIIIIIFPNFFINLWSGLCQNGPAEVAQVAPMGVHATVGMPDGPTDPCHGVGVPKHR